MVGSLENSGSSSSSSVKNKVDIISEEQDR